MTTISGHIVDVVSKKITDGIITIEKGLITAIVPSDNVDNQYILPGLIDAHIHIESSMMLPSEFARLAAPHGTIACVSDPHEIANVCGVKGVEYMIENGKKSPVRFYFGAPSCVPATDFETSGAILDAGVIEELMKNPDILYLGEMMNFPGVLYDDKQVLLKLKAAIDNGKPIDGHAPDLSGDGLRKYISSGVSTDHECMSISEAEEKIAFGMKIIIREGSAAKNFDTLLPLIENYPEDIMFCSDDKHPDDLLKNGHIDSLVKRAVAKGFNPIDILRACSYNPVKHYNLNAGLLQTGDYADFIIADNLKDFNIKATYIDGNLVAENGKACFDRVIPEEIINAFVASKIDPGQLKVEPKGSKIKVIEAEDGQLYTKYSLHEPKIIDGNIVSDVENDILKLVVYNRYQQTSPAIGFIRNFGLKRGALVSTVAHDSHNIVAVGTSDEEIASAINLIIECKGGILAKDAENVCLMPLPVGGLMSDADGFTISEQYEKTDAMAKLLGSKLSAPFMTLAFMSLLCIPELKLGDKGLFEILKLSFTDLQE
jgi:adenine deaminase